MPRTPNYMQADEHVGTMMAHEDDEFQKDVRINKYRLDEECLSQSSRYAYWSEAYALAKTNLVAAKDNLEYTKAMRSIALRNLYQETGEKFTEVKLESAVLIDDEYLEAKAKYREADEVCNKMMVAVNAMEMRKSELDNLVKLYVAGYFSTVSSGENNKRDANEQVSRDIRKNLNKEKDNG